MSKHVPFLLMHEIMTQHLDKVFGDASVCGNQEL